MSNAADAKPRAPIIFALVSCYVLLRCLWRVLIPATEYQMPPWPLVSMGSDILLLIVLFVLKPQLPEATSGSPIYVRYATPLFVAAITATAIMLLIRFSSNSGWWTGHLMYGF